jgi:hypothetical protein
VSNKSLSERLQFVVEDDGACATCSGGGGDSDQGGDLGGEGGDEGPNAGYDKLVKGLNMIRRRKKKVK